MAELKDYSAQHLLDELSSRELVNLSLVDTSKIILELRNRKADKKLNSEDQSYLFELIKNCDEIKSLKKQIDALKYK